MNLSSEPVRTFALIAGLLVAAGTALIDVGAGIDVATSIGKAIVAFGLVVGGGELGRTQVTPTAEPVTANGVPLIPLDAVSGQLELEQEEMIASYEQAPNWEAVPLDPEAGA